jgi:tetratricopeptide (TPR) repeat protein
MTFPIVLLILDAYPLRRLGRGADRAVLLEKVPYAVLALTAALAAFAAQRSVEEMRTLAEHGPLARIAQAAYGLCFYVVKTLVPVALSPAYLLRPPLDPTEPRYVVSLLVAGGITLAVLAARRRAPWALAAWASYVVIVAPVLGFAQTGPQLVADRYTYLACLPFSLLLAAALIRLRRSEALTRVATAAAAVALVVLGVLSVRQTSVWRDPLTLWTHVLRLDPENYVAYTNRGWARTDPETAIADYSAAIRINPRYYLAYFNRGNARHQRGNLDGAIDDFTTAIALLPADPKAYNNRGWSREARGDFAGAAADYERALEVAAPEWRQRDLVRGNLLRARERIAAGAS